MHTSTGATGFRMAADPASIAAFQASQLAGLAFSTAPLKPKFRAMVSLRWCTGWVFQVFSMISTPSGVKTSERFSAGFAAVMPPAP